MKKLTETQQKLLIEVSKYMGQVNSIEYSILKSLVNYPSFDSSFNALLLKGYVVRVTNHDNRYILK